MNVELDPKNVHVSNHSNAQLHISAGWRVDRNGGMGQLMIRVQDANGPDRPSPETLLEASCTLEREANFLRLRAKDGAESGELDALDAEEHYRRAQSLHAAAVWLDALRLSL